MPRRNSTAALAKENERLRARLEAMKAGVAGEERVGAPAIAEIEKRAQLSGTVTVACKVDIGLTLQLQRPMTRRIPTGKGYENDYEEIEFMVKTGKAYHVFGPAVPAQVSSDYIMPHGMEGGYALTHGIPAAFWAEWLEQNQLADYVVNKMIFAFDPASAKAAAREHAELKSGMEPLSREADDKGFLKDRRVPRSLNAAVSRVAFDADRTAQQTQQPKQES